MDEKSKAKALDNKKHKDKYEQDDAKTKKKRKRLDEKEDKKVKKKSKDHKKHKKSKEQSIKHDERAEEVTKISKRSKEKSEGDKIKNKDIQGEKDFPEKSDVVTMINKIQSRKPDQNTNALSSIKERRKLLWGDTPSTTSNESKNDWSKSQFNKPQDKLKFLKLMGMKNVDNVEVGNGTDEKQVKILGDLEKEFNQGIQYKSHYYSKRGLS